MLNRNWFRIPSSNNGGPCTKLASLRRTQVEAPLTQPLPECVKGRAKDLVGHFLPSPDVGQDTCRVFAYPPHTSQYMKKKNIPLLHHSLGYHTDFGASHPDMRVFALFLRSLSIRLGWGHFCLKLFLIPWVSWRATRPAPHPEYTAGCQWDPIGPLFISADLSTSELAHLSFWIDHCV